MARPFVTIERSRGFLATYVWVILAMMALAGAGAYAIVSTQEVSYTSKSVVVVQPTISSAGVSLPPDMGTEQEIALSGSVAGVVAHKLGMTEVQALKHLSVSVPVNAMALQFAYTAPTRAAAHRGAAAFTDAYVAERNGTPHAGTQAKGNRGTGKGAGHAAKRPVLVKVVTRADYAPSPDGANLPVVLGLSLILGGIVGLGAALLWDRASDRLRGAVDLGEQTGLPVLASVPTLSGPLTPRLFGRTTGPVGELYGHLVTQMPKLLDAKWGHSVLVTSPSRGAGKSTIASQLAVSLAQLGKNVVLVEADARHPVLEDWFCLLPGPGMSEVIAGKVPLELALRGTNYPHLQVLTAGQAGSAGNVFDLEYLQLLIGRLSRGALVILDAPTCTEAAETAQLATRVDQVVLVCDVRRGLRRDARAAVVALSHVLDKVSGAVANRPTPGRAQSRRPEGDDSGQEIAAPPDVDESGRSPVTPPTPTRSETESPSTPSPASADK